jgi:hypothetical protein
MKLATKITLPTQIPMRYLFPVVCALFGLQMVEGTRLFTGLTFCAFIVVMTDAFNLCGGLAYPSGSYIFFGGLLTMILGGLVKMVMGESLDSNLLDAQKSMLVYLAGACSLWVAAKINVRIRRKKPLLSKFQLTDHFDQTAIGSALLGQFGAILIPTAYLSTFNQANNFLPLALLIGVYGTTLKWKGWRSFSPLNFFLWAWSTVIWGVFSFSKQGMFSPAVAWALGATIAGYWITTKRLIFLLVFVIGAATFLTPIAQVGRIYRDTPDASQKALDMLFHPLRTREQYLATIGDQKVSDDIYHWFDKSQGLLDRLTMLPIDDALIHETDQGHSETIFPIETYVINMIPRYVVSDKVVYHWGNRYAHEIGMLGRNDMTTGISFSPFADGYHCVQWWGVTVVSMPIFLMMFWVCDSLTGSTKDTLWAAFYILQFSHAAPEGMLVAPFLAVSTLALAVILAAILAKYLLPALGGLFLPVRRVLPIASRTVRGPSPMSQATPRTIGEKL